MQKSKKLRRIIDQRNSRDSAHKKKSWILFTKTKIRIAENVQTLSNENESQSAMKSNPITKI